MSNRSIRKRSQLQEKRAADDVGGRTVAGSGAARHSGGGDVRKPGEMRIECKFTEKAFYSLQYADLIKIKTQALKGGMEFPVMQIEFITAPLLKVAVFPELTQGALQLVTEGRSIRLRRDELIRLLLDSPHIYLGFVPKGGPQRRETFAVMRWGSFLERMEEENEC